MESKRQIVRIPAVSKYNIYFVDLCFKSIVDRLTVKNATDYVLTKIVEKVNLVQILQHI